MVTVTILLWIAAFILAKNRGENIFDTLEITLRNGLEIETTNWFLMAALISTAATIVWGIVTLLLLIGFLL